jgi:hypothetical protein
MDDEVMIIQVMVVASVLGILMPQSCAHPDESAHFHWSVAQVILAPNCRWAFGAVYATSSDGKARLLFRLNRDADILWSQDSDQLGIIDENANNNYHLRLFNLEDPIPSETKAL